MRFEPLCPRGSSETLGLARRAHRIRIVVIAHYPGVVRHSDCSLLLRINLDRCPSLDIVCNEAERSLGRDENLRPMYGPDFVWSCSPPLVVVRRIRIVVLLPLLLLLCPAVVPQSGSTPPSRTLPSLDPGR